MPTSALTAVAVLDNPGFYVTYALLQAIALIVLVRLVDRYDREPLASVALVAAWGATGAPVLALLGNTAIEGLLSPRTQTVFGAAIAAPVVEELAKGLALVAIAAASWWASSRFGTSGFSGVTDGLLYGVAVGLGFAFTEDFFYFLNRATTAGLDSGFELFVARRDFFGPQSLHHPLFTAPFGVGLGLATWSRSRRWRIAFPVLGLLLAILIHAVNNGLVEAILTLRFGIDATAAYVSGGPVSDELLALSSEVLRWLRGVDYTYIALAVLGIAGWQRYQRRTVYRELRSEVSTGLVHSADREAVVHPLRRARTSLYLLRRRDFDGWRHLRSYHRAVGRLGLMKWRTARFGLEHRRLREARRELAAMRAVTAHPVPTTQSHLEARGREIEHAIDLLQRDGVRAVTVTGPSGVGKRSLAVEVATRFSGLAAGGAHVIRVAEAEDVAVETARALEVKELPGVPLPTRLAQQGLVEHTVLVVLVDRPDGAAEAIAGLLRAAPRLQVVTVATEALGLPGERTLALAPLPLTRPRVRRRRAVAQAPAVAVFLHAAQASHRSFVLDDRTEPAVRGICAVLGGLPLAIELVAPWVKFVPVDDILDELTALADDRQPLEAALEWVHGRLDPDERRLFEDLGLFGGPFTAEAVEAVSPMGPGAQWGVFETLVSLTERNLVRRRGDETGERRFALPFALDEEADRRRAARPADEAEVRFSAYYRALAERAERHLDGDDAHEWRLVVGADHANFVAALAYADAHGDDDTVGRTVAALRRYWAHGVLGDARRWLTTDRLVRIQDPGAQARAAAAAGELALLQAAIPDARAAYGCGLEAARAVGDDALTGEAVCGMGWVELLGGSPAAAVTAFEEGVRSARKGTDERVLADRLTWLGRALAESGATDAARGPLESAHKLRRFLDDGYAEADSLAHLGRLALLEGRNEQAVPLLEESISISRRLTERISTLDDVRLRALVPRDRDREWLAVGAELGARLRAGEALHSLALTAIDQDELRVAVPLLNERLAICRWLGDRIGIVESLECFALVALASASATSRPAAGRLAAFADVLREQLSLPRWPADVERRDRIVSRAALAPEDGERWRREAEEVTIDEATEDAVAHAIVLLNELEDGRPRRRGGTRAMEAR